MGISNGKKNVEDIAECFEQGEAFSLACKIDNDMIFKVMDFKNDCWKDFPSNKQRSCAISSKFKNIIESAMRCQRVDSHEGYLTVYINDIEPEIFAKIIKYADGIGTSFPSRLLWPMRSVAGRYAIHDLFHDLTEILLRNVNEYNFCKYFLQFGKTKDISSMIRCIEKIKDEFWDHKELIASDTFLQFRIYPELQMILTSRTLKVEKQTLLRRCIEWSQNQKVLSNKIALNQLDVCLEIAFMEEPTMDHVITPISENVDEDPHLDGISPAEARSSCDKKCQNKNDVVVVEAISYGTGYSDDKMLDCSETLPSPRNSNLQYCDSGSESSCSPLSLSDLKGQLERPKFGLNGDVTDKAVEAYNMITSFTDNADHATSESVSPNFSRNWNMMGTTVKCGIIPICEAAKVVV